MKHVILLKNRTTPKDPYHTRLSEELYNPIFIPLLKHSHFDKTETIKYLKSDDFLKTPYFIITSQRAVEIFGECLKEIKDESILSTIFKKIGYTVGPATFKVLTEIGFVNVKGGADAGNGSALAEIVMREVDRSQKIIFFTGVVRKDIIPKRLKENQYRLQEKIIYKTESRDDILPTFKSTSDNIEGSPESDSWIVFFSPQGTESIVQYIKDKDLKHKIASIGPTTEEYLKLNSLEPMVTSKYPEANSLFESLQSYDSSL